MSASMSVEEKLDAVLRRNQEITSSNQELKAQNEYLRKQLGAYIKQKQKMNEEPSFNEPRVPEQVLNHTLESSSDEEAWRRPRNEQRAQSNSNDFRVEIPEYEGKLDP